MKTSQKIELYKLAHDIIGPLKSMEGLIYILKSTGSKIEAENICIRLKQCQKSIDKKIDKAIVDLANGTFNYNKKK